MYAGSTTWGVQAPGWAAGGDPLRIQAELAGTRGTREGRGREERWAVLFIKYRLTKPAWRWSSRLPLRHMINHPSAL